MPIPQGRARLALGVAASLMVFAALSGRDGDWVLAVGSQSGEQSPGMVSESAIATVTCEFRQGGDDVALAGGPGSVVIADGWWERGDCPVLPAKVSVRLQAHRDGNWWDAVWAATASVPPGGRAEASFRCHSAERTRWRSVIEVDLSDRPDGSGELRTKPQRLRCGPGLATLQR